MQPEFFDLIGFGCAFAIAGTVSASFALALSGKRTWAFELAMVVSLAIAIAVVLAALALWVAPMALRSRMDAWFFLQLREDALRWGEILLRFYSPLGLGTGIVVGGIAGRLIVLARRRPRLGTGIALGLLAACASGPVRPILFGLVVLWGRVILWSEWLISRSFSTWPMTPDEVWATAAILGAIAARVVACLSTRRPRSAVVPRTAEDRGPDFPQSPRFRERNERGRKQSGGSAPRDDARKASDGS